MKIRILFLVLLFCNLTVKNHAQYTISGFFPLLSGQTILLVGFEGFGIYTIDSSKVDEKGQFNLKYHTKDRGMGYLMANDKKPYFVVLANENIELKGNVLSQPESINCLAGTENKQFVQYAVEHPKHEQALSAWDYLWKIYRNDSLFASQYQTKQLIENEISRIKRVDVEYLSTLNPSSYVSWFLPTRKLVSSVSTIAQYRTEEIPTTINAFRKLDYTDHRLYKSGLYKDVIDNQFWLLENMGQPLDTVYKEMKISIDYLLDNLLDNEEKFNQITSHLFQLLEQHSLFQASEYLAVKILNQNSCTLNDNFEKQLETYRAMKIGNTAPDIAFTGTSQKKGLPTSLPKKLSEIKSLYTVVIFGASWCPRCSEELSLIPKLYNKWVSKGVEVVFVSLDNDMANFQNFTKLFPFISTCDYKKWESQAAKEYYVFATPTLFLLDANRKIILRPGSVKQVDAWVDFYLNKRDK